MGFRSFYQEIRPRNEVEAYLAGIVVMDEGLGWSAAWEMKSELVRISFFRPCDPGFVHETNSTPAPRRRHSPRHAAAA